MSIVFCRSWLSIANGALVSSDVDCKTNGSFIWTAHASLYNDMKNLSDKTNPFTCMGSAGLFTAYCFCLTYDEMLGLVHYVTFYGGSSLVNCVISVFRYGYSCCTLMCPILMSK